jgi:hypothetical protein
MSYIGYVTAANIASYPGTSLGDYVSDDANHDNGDRGFYIIQGDISATVSNSGGDALLTKSAHGLSTGAYIGVKDTRVYMGIWYVEVITANTFKLRKRAGAAFKTYSVAETVTYYTARTSHDAKNFSLGAGSDGYSRYQDFLISGSTASLVGSYAYENHNTNGGLKYIEGGSGNYSGPVGSRFWLIYRAHTTSVTNSGGNALFTHTSHGLIDGDYIMVKGYNSWGNIGAVYSGYYYVDVISSNTFMLKTNASGSYLAYLTNETVTYQRTVGASKMEGVDVKGTADVPVIITNMGGQFIARKLPESAATYGWEWFGGAEYVYCTGKYDPVRGTGHTNYRGHDSSYRYSSGTYGMWFMFYNENSNNACFNVGAGATDWEVSYIEVDGGTRGFAGIMFKTDNQPDLTMDNIIIHDCYIHDVEGEGCYIGNTGDNTPGSAPVQHWIRLHLYNNRFVRCGVEILQTGQLKDGSVVENNVAYLGTLTHMAPFFLGQSNAVQLKPRSGNVWWRNNVVVGGTANMILIQSNRADEALDSTKSLFVQNSVFHYGRQRWMYFELDRDGTMPFIMENIWMKNIVPYDSDRNDSKATDELEIILTNDETTETTMNNFFIDSSMDSRTVPVENWIATFYNMVRYQTSQNLDELEFVKSGYEGLNVLDIHTWFENYNPLHDTHPGEAIVYTPADMVMDLGLFYKCISTHSATATRPAQDVTHWTQIFWDVNGYSSLHPDYNGVPYSTKAPDDLRLIANNFYNTRNIGLTDNETNTRTTYYTWEYAYDDGGSPDESFIQTLPFKTRVLDSSATDVSPAITRLLTRSGDWIRRKIQVITPWGTVAPPHVGDWEQIP